jgi:hypothetical protein
VVPSAGKPQALNRYAYTFNNPLKYTDPSGHFTQEAIENYLKDTYQDDWDKYLKWWKDDKSWWGMLSEAQAGDVLFGGSRDRNGTSSGFLFQFQGEGSDKLTSISNLDPQGKNYSLAEIQRGYAGPAEWAKYTLLNWIGIIRGFDSKPSFYIRSGYDIKQKTTSDAIRDASAVAYAGLGIGLTALTGPIKGALINLAGAKIPDLWADAMDIQPGDAQIHISQGTLINAAYMNFQGIPGGGYQLEYYNYNARFTYPRAICDAGLGPFYACH